MTKPKMQKAGRTLAALIFALVLLVAVGAPAFDIITGMQAVMREAAPQSQKP